MKMRSKKNYIVLVLLLLTCISIGYAVLNTTLDITGKTSIGKSTWSVHFENIQITTGSAEAVKVPTIENSTTVDFEVGLNLPGDFYEFTVDVVNSGTIDAMIESITKEPELTSDQKKYLNYIIEYENKEQITTKQLVKPEAFVRLKVRVEYKEDLTASELPSEDETLNLGFIVNYIQSDGTGSSVNSNGAKVVPTAYGSLEEIGTVVTIGTEKFYTIGTEGDNVKLLSMYNLHVGSEVTDLNLKTDELTMNVISNPTGMQSSNAKGAIVNNIDYENQQAEYLFPWVGVTAFSSEEKHGTDYNDYEGSIVKGYVVSYASLLESKFDIEIEEARLITKEELTDSNTFKCSEEENSCLNSPYSWIYSTTYWSGSANGTNLVWGVTSICDFVNLIYDYDYGAGVRPVIVIPKSEVKVEEIKPVANGDINEIGTIVTIGTEQFYTIGTEENNVKLLSMYNLHVGSEVKNVNLETQEVDMSGISNPTGMQSSNAKGALVNILDYENEQFEYLFPWVGVTAFASEEKHGTNYSDYEGSIVERYVVSYASLLESIFDIEIDEARLITKEELTDSNTFKCSEEDNSCLNSPYPWIYSTTYWSGSVDDADYVWSVSSFGYFGYDSSRYGYIAGVRPVIVISKDYF